MCGGARVGGGAAWCYLSALMRPSTRRAHLLHLGGGTDSAMAVQGLYLPGGSFAELQFSLSR